MTNTSTEGYERPAPAPEEEHTGGISPAERAALAEHAAASTGTAETDALNDVIVAAERVFKDEPDARFGPDPTPTTPATDGIVTPDNPTNPLVDPAEVPGLVVPGTRSKAWNERTGRWVDAGPVQLVIPAPEPTPPATMQGDEPEPLPDEHLVMLATELDALRKAPANQASWPVRTAVRYADRLLAEVYRLQKAMTKAEADGAGARAEADRLHKQRGQIGQALIAANDILDEPVEGIRRLAAARDEARADLAAVKVEKAGVEGERDAIEAIVTDATRRLAGLLRATTGRGLPELVDAACVHIAQRGSAEHARKRAEQALDTVRDTLAEATGVRPGDDIAAAIRTLDAQLAKRTAERDVARQENEGRRKLLASAVAAQLAMRRRVLDLADQIEREPHPVGAATATAMGIVRRLRAIVVRPAMPPAQTAQDGPTGAVGEVPGQGEAHTPEGPKSPIVHPTEFIASTWVYNMMPVRVLDNTDGTVLDEGHVFGYLDTPSITLLHADGITETWSISLPWQVVGEPTPVETQRTLLAARRSPVRHRLSSDQRASGTASGPMSEMDFGAALQAVADARHALTTGDTTWPMGQAVDAGERLGHEVLLRGKELHRANAKIALLTTERDQARRELAELAGATTDREPSEAEKAAREHLAAQNRGEDPGTDWPEDVRLLLDELAEMQRFIHLMRLLADRRRGEIGRLNLALAAAVNGCETLRREAAEARQALVELKPAAAPVQVELDGELEECATVLGREATPLHIALGERDRTLLDKIGCGIDMLTMIISKLLSSPYSATHTAPVAKHGCDECSVETSEPHRWVGCPGIERAGQRAQATTPGSDATRVTPAGPDDAINVAYRQGWHDGHEAAPREMECEPLGTHYLDTIAREIGKVTDGCSRDLLRIYALLALTTGTATTARQVHDAWSAWRANTQPNHRSLLPFDELAEDVRALDGPHAAAIRAVAAGLPTTAPQPEPPITTTPAEQILAAIQALPAEPDWVALIDAMPAWHASGARHAAAISGVAVSAGTAHQLAEDAWRQALTVCADIALGIVPQQPSEPAEPEHSPIEDAAWMDGEEEARGQCSCVCVARGCDEEHANEVLDLHIRAEEADRG